MASKSMKQLCIEKIAADHGIETLDIRNSDSLDFHDVGVWAIKEMLEEAFKMGRQTADVEVDK